MAWIARVTLVVPWIAASLVSGGCLSKEQAMSDDKPAVSRPLGVEDAIGLWQVSSGSGGKATCRIALDRFAQSGGYGVHVEACEIASFRGVRTWRPIENGFELVGPSGDVIAAFRRQGVDAFSAADGPYRLERAPLA